MGHTVEITRQKVDQCFKLGDARKYGDFREAASNVRREIYELFSEISLNQDRSAVEDQIFKSTLHVEALYIRTDQVPEVTDDAKKATDAMLKIEDQYEAGQQPNLGDVEPHLNRLNLALEELQLEALFTCLKR